MPEVLSASSYSLPEHISPPSRSSIFFKIFRCYECGLWFQIEACIYIHMCNMSLGVFWVHDLKVERWRWGPLALRQLWLQRFLIRYFPVFPSLRNRVYPERRLSCSSSSTHLILFVTKHLKILEFLAGHFRGLKLNFFFFKQALENEKK